MRTKALLLTAALGLAGAATSMAQAVYSVNVVGYINLTMKPGFNLVANQLKASPNNGLNSVLPNANLASAVYKFSNATGNFTIDYSDGSAWFTPEGVPTTTTVSPGEGFFFFNPDSTDAGVTLVGEVTTGNNLQVSLPTGFSLVSSVVPQDIALTAANGFPQSVASQYMPYNTTAGAFDTYFNDGTGWFTAEGAPIDATVRVGQGFFYFNAGGASENWTRSFNPNN